VAAIHGIAVDKTFGDRFNRTGLDTLVAEAIRPAAAAKRLHQGISWLRESRVEQAVNAAVVKLAIGYEGLLGGNDTEPLRRALSERSAFLLSDQPSLRHEISRLVKSFYDLRSQVVHGATRKKSKPASVDELEAAERLLLLLLVTIATNNELLAADDSVLQWVEQQRWGANRVLRRPFRPGDLKRALSKCLRGI
jgi:hypothetical protein